MEDGWRSLDEHFLQVRVPPGIEASSLWTRVSDGSMKVLVLETCSQSFSSERPRYSIAHRELFPFEPAIVQGNAGTLCELVSTLFERNWRIASSLALPDLDWEEREYRIRHDQECNRGGECVDNSGDLSTDNPCPGPNDEFVRWGKDALDALVEERFREFESNEDAEPQFPSPRECILKVHEMHTGKCNHRYDCILENITAYYKVKLKYCI
ncbi:hypothetical protein AGR4C_pa50038 [Agrobacterium tumefaciens str. Kerr 14]|uniref:Uncharacterized protein n=1 Tax=Agrobacterium tumefaciens str. Kerr 14 TaxID=1183424 RepID=A0A1S7SB49_AGRTU|nr:hypothetical protein AGR4C_pa50038 [Agrobacterium tumefaciens str. Kerr 14]